jgi:hypothetical protein
MGEVLPRDQQSGLASRAGTIFPAASRVDERRRRRGQAESGGPLCAPLPRGAQAAEGPPSAMGHTTAGLQTAARDGEDGRGGRTRGRTGFGFHISRTKMEKNCIYKVSFVKLIKNRWPDILFVPEGVLLGWS